MKRNLSKLKLPNIQIGSVVVSDTQTPLAAASKPNIFDNLGKMQRIRGGLITHSTRNHQKQFLTTEFNQMITQFEKDFNLAHKQLMRPWQHPQINFPA